MMIDKKLFLFKGNPSSWIANQMTEITPDLEKKNKKKILMDMKEEYKNFGIKFDWEMCGEAIDRVFKELRK